MDNCFCTPGNNNNNNTNRRSSSIVKGGLISKNGIDFFPEEFLFEKKKSALKKSVNDSRSKPDKNTNTGF